MSSEDIDIVTQLSDAQAKCDLSPCDCLCFLHEDAIYEIVLLRKLAYLLIDELRFNGGYEAYTSKMLFDEFYEQAVRGE